MKTKITLAVLLFLFALPAFAQSNLIGCYPLDNNPDDFSGNNYNGTAYNLTPTSDRFFNPDHAYNFPGTNSGILIDDTPFHLNSYTYSVWCKLTSLPSVGSYYCVVSIGGSNADQVLLVGNNPVFGHIGFGFGSYDSILSDHSYWQGTFPNIMQWYHVVITRDNDTMKLFIDNNPLGFHTTGNNAGYLGTPHAFSIGSRGDTLTQNFIGDIDEVKIIDRVLTTAEIALLDSTCNLFTGIRGHESEENTISVFPNPFTTDLVLRGTTARGELVLWDVLSKEIIRQKTFTSETRINTKNLLPGIYFLSYSEENKSANSKLVKF